jgi:hypothetical protein
MPAQGSSNRADELATPAVGYACPKDLPNFDHFHLLAFMFSFVQSVDGLFPG